MCCSTALTTQCREFCSIRSMRKSSYIYVYVHVLKTAAACRNVYILDSEIIDNRVSMVKWRDEKLVPYAIS